MVDIRTRFDDRKKRVEMVCDKQHSSGGSKYLITSNRPHNISVCIVPKAGATFWLRLLKFLSGQNRKTGNPMSISKYEVYYKDLQFLKQLKPPNQQFIAKSLKVMTVRNPYTRLLSAYIDKFVLLDFWQKKGKRLSG